MYKIKKAAMIWNFKSIRKVFKGVSVSKRLSQESVYNEENVSFIKNFCSIHCFDKFFAPIAIDVVVSQQWCTTQFMRKYTTSSVHTRKIADALTELGVITELAGVKSRRVLCKDLEQLRKILTETPEIEEIAKRYIYQPPLMPDWKRDAGKDRPVVVDICNLITTFHGLQILTRESSGLQIQKNPFEHLD